MVLGEYLALLKAAKVLLVLLMVVWLWRTGKKEPELARHAGWPLIFAGLFVILFGDVLNFSGSTVYQGALHTSAWIAGYVLLAIGFKHWLPLVSGIRKAEQELKRVNEALELQVQQRTAELQAANARLEQDIEERTLAEQNIRHLAHHDTLTGLPNRALFRDRLDHAMLQAARHQQQLAVMFLDLDRFKTINDTLGHNAGDQLLKIVAERLRSCVRDCDTVARLGGDEFTVIVEDIFNTQDAATVAQKIIDTVSRPFSLHGHEVFISTSIGITVYPDDDDNADNLLRNADAAMYRAKEQGRNNYQFYIADMNVRARERLTIENSLRRALERDEFTLHYQPRVDIYSGQVIGVEALLRWTHPEMGALPPSRFIHILEETGLIIEVGEWVLRTACAQNRKWQDMGLPCVRMAVNLSVRQFMQKDLAGSVQRALDDTGLDAQYLELEITEALLLESNQVNTAALNKLKVMGIHISIDDFGTGYSSLSYLRRLPIDTLKIDQSFVRDITTDSDGAAIASAIIAMACSLHLNVLAEGVETDEQLTFLRAQGCNEIQGYSFSHPLPADEFEQLLRDGRQMMVLQGLSGYYVNMVSNGVSYSH